jgi:ssDNA-binding replication factor A large subunit
VLLRGTHRQRRPLRTISGRHPTGRAWAPSLQRHFSEVRGVTKERTPEKKQGTPSDDVIIGAEGQDLIIH